MFFILFYFFFFFFFFVYYLASIKNIIKFNIMDLIAMLFQKKVIMEKYLIIILKTFLFSSYKFIQLFISYIFLVFIYYSLSVELFI
jgi:hypothetical protein